MTRGELIRERKAVIVENHKKQLKKGIKDFTENKVDYLWEITLFIAVTMFIGAVGTADISETIPESSILIGAFSLLYVVVYGIIKCREED